MLETLPLAVRQRILVEPGRVACTRQLAEVGVDRFAVAQMVRDGLLDRLAPAHVRLPDDVAPEQAGHLAVAYLRHHRPEDEVQLTGAYATSLYAGVAPTGLPAVRVPHGRRVRVRRGPWSTVQSDLVDPSAPLTHRGLPLAGIPLALADHAADPSVSDARLVDVLYRVLTSTRVSPVDLVAGWSRLGTPGARRMLEMAAQGVLEHESPAELRMFRTVFSAHPAPPDCQVQLARSIRVDFAWCFAALVVEYLGEDAHAGRLDHDTSRTFALGTLGFETIAVTRSLLRDPDGLRRHIHTRRREREDLMLRGLLRRPELPRQPDRLTPLRTLLPSG